MFVGIGFKEKYVRCIGDFKIKVFVNDGLEYSFLLFIYEFGNIFLVMFIWYFYS